MALIVCEECGQSVSDKADSCPKCGKPIAGTLGYKSYYGHHKSHQTSRVTDTNTWLWVLVALLIIGMSILGYYLFEGESINRRGDKIEVPHSTELDYNSQENETNARDSKHDGAVAQLKELLAKTDGMKFGDDKMALTRCNYDEKKNIVEFHYTQRVFTRSEGTPDLIAELTNTMRKSRKEAIKEITVLMRLMEPLRPTIRDIIYYPDGSVAYTYDIKYNDLYYNN